MDERDSRAGSTGPGTRAGYELSDISTKVTVVSAIALVVAGVVVHVLVWLLYVAFGQAASASYSPQYPLAAAGAPPLPPAPMLQVKPREELKQLVSEEEAVLHSTTWVDRNAGIVRIPIERAMQLVVERGLPVRTGSGAAAAPAPVGQASRLSAASRVPGTSRVLDGGRRDAGPLAAGHASRLHEASGTPQKGATPGTGWR